MNTYPAAGRVTGPNTDIRVGGLPPLPREPAAVVGHPETVESGNRHVVG